MQAPLDNPRKRLFRQLTQILFLAGVVIVAIPFFSSSETHTTTTSLDINVADMREGETRQLLWDNRPVFILRRSATMLEELRQANDVLADPWSKRSQQPDNAKNVYRSVTPEFFVSFLGCEGGGYPLIYQDNKLVCEQGGSIYDLAGRVYTDMADRKNLAVPEYTFTENGVLRLLGAGREE